MTRRPELVPGQPIDVEAFNASVRYAGNRLTSAVDMAIQGGETGGALIPRKDIPEVWGRLTKKGPDSSPDFFEWEEVQLDGDLEWQTVEIDDAMPPYGSHIAEGDEEEELLFDPAVEVNGGQATIGDVVRLTPAEQIVDQDRTIENEFMNHWVHRAWVFELPNKLRAFRLIQDLIPRMDVFDRTVQAEWLDDVLAAPVTLFSPHQRIPNPNEDILQYGIGRAPAQFFRGTYGWARYEPRGTSTGVDQKGNDIWRGEWQIVTLYAETIIEAEVKDTGGVESDATGRAEFKWFDKDKFADEEIFSGFQVTFYNSLRSDLDEGDRIRLHYNRERHIWVTLGPPLPSIMTVYATGTGAQTATDNVLVQIDLNTVLFADGVSDTFAETDFPTGHSIELNAAAKGVKNIGVTALIVRVSWSVTCERVMTVQDTDVNSWCEVVLLNDLNEITGLVTRMTSSRRNQVVPGPSYADQGAGAVNTCSGNSTQKLNPGESLTLWIRKNLRGTLGGGTNPNDWISLSDRCHMTVEVIHGVVLKPVP